MDPINKIEITILPETVRIDNELLSTYSTIVNKWHTCEVVMLLVWTECLIFNIPNYNSIDLNISLSAGDSRKRSGVQWTLFIQSSPYFVSYCYIIFLNSVIPLFIRPYIKLNNNKLNTSKQFCVYILSTFHYKNYPAFAFYSLQLSNSLVQKKKTDSKDLRQSYVIFFEKNVVSL